MLQMYAPNVCSEPLMRTKQALSPRCICNKGFDLKSQNKILFKQLIAIELMQIDKKNMLWLKMELVSLLMFALELLPRHTKFDYRFSKDSLQAVQSAQSTMRNLVKYCLRY